MSTAHAENVADRGASKLALAWVGKVDCPDDNVDATAALAPDESSVGSLVQPLWPGGRLRLLTSVLLDSVPVVLFTSVAFGLYINAGPTEHSKKYVNGLVNSLMPPMQNAVLARIEGSEPALAAAHDPFVDARDSTPTSGLPTSPFVIIYAEPSTPPRLALHLLDTSVERLESLALAATGSESCAEQPEECELRSEYAFIEHMAKRSSAEQQDRMQRTLSAESTMLSGNATLSRTFSAPRTRPNKRMTLSDIEHFAAGSTGNKPEATEPVTAHDEPSEQIEQANKKLAKQLIIASLKKHGVTRDHKDFAALWGQIYRSLKFALRSKISCLTYSIKDLRGEVEKHTKFYCAD
ncbi:hypothetical protein IWW50_003613 [Coemansia erecta]|nr:hypothetical protein IWW50_003613 [Coemansia erecta]